MKKKLLFLCSLIMCMSAVFAQESPLHIMGTIIYDGFLYEKEGSDDAHARTDFTCLNVTADADYGAYGAKVILETSTGGPYSRAALLDQPLNIQSAFAYTDFDTDGLFKLYAGLGIEAIAYSPNCAELDPADPNFGLGLGEYDEDDGTDLTAKVSGYAAEFAYEGLSVAATYDVPEFGLDATYHPEYTTVEDSIQDNTSVNLKYDYEGVGTLFAGAAFEQGADYMGLFGGCSIKAIEDLSLDLKYETILDDEDVNDTTMLSAYGIYTIVEGLTDFVAEVNYTTDSGDIMADMNLNYKPSMDFPVKFILSEKIITTEVDETTGDKEYTLDTSFGIQKRLGMFPFMQATIEPGYKHYTSDVEGVDDMGTPLCHVQNTRHVQIVYNLFSMVRVFAVEISHFSISSISF